MGVSKVFNYSHEETKFLAMHWQSVIDLPDHALSELFCLFNVAVCVEKQQVLFRIEYVARVG